MRSSDVLDELRGLGDPAGRDDMARFGINPERALGIRIPQLRALARRIGRDHAMAAELWASAIHEARILAAFVEDPSQVTPEQMEAWTGDFDSWDVCDQTCSAVFARTPYAYDKAEAWSEREDEFVKRAGFALMAALAVHDKRAADEKLAAFLPLIEREAGDGRNLVRKAVNWALRQIGKRSAALNAEAVACAERILEGGPRSARWVASDALRELRGDVVRTKLGLP
jgi:3-methyladenine DNA glycosylase AlkD